MKAEQFRLGESGVLAELERMARLFAKARGFGVAFRKHVTRIEQILSEIIEERPTAEQSVLSTARAHGEGEDIARIIGTQAETLLAFARIGEQQTLKIIELATRNGSERIERNAKFDRKLKKKKQKIANLKAKLAIQTAINEKLRFELEKLGGSSFVRFSHCSELAEVKLRVTPLRELCTSKEINGKERTEKEFSAINQKQNTLKNIANGSEAIFNDFAQIRAKPSLTSSSSDPLPDSSLSETALNVIPVSASFEFPRRSASPPNQSRKAPPEREANRLKSLLLGDSDFCEETLAKNALLFQRETIIEHSREESYSLVEYNTNEFGSHFGSVRSFEEKETKQFGSLRVVSTYSKPELGEETLKKANFSQLFKKA